MAGGVAVVAVATIVIVVVALDQRGGTVAEARLAPADAHALGPADAPVTIVEFADFQCPFCRDFALVMQPQIIKDYVDTGKVRFIYRHLAFLGNESVRAAEASECAGDQGKFWEYHDTLFENWGGENVGAFSDANLVAFATPLGLDTPTFTACLDSGRYAQRVQDEKKAAGDLGVTSTPTIFINGERLPGLRDYSAYRQVIEEDLTKSR